MAAATIATSMAAEIVAVAAMVTMFLRMSGDCVVNHKEVRKRGMANHGGYVDANTQNFGREKFR